MEDYSESTIEPNNFVFFNHPNWVCSFVKQLSETGHFRQLRTPVCKVARQMDGFFNPLDYLTHPSG